MAEAPRDWNAVLERLLAGDRVAFLELNCLLTGFLTQLRAVSPAAHSIEMDVPADWLAPGVFRVELRQGRSDRGREEPVAYELSVRPTPE